jgi:hypothetical protein
MQKQPATTKSNLPSVQFEWRHVVSCLVVGVAIFIFVGLFWPMTSRGFRASTKIDFSLPGNITSLSDREVKQLKSVLGQTIAKTLSGASFDSLITQTKRTGSVNSNEIEYRDLEAIRNSIDLGFDFWPDGGRIEIGYRCAGRADQLRFLQLLGHRISTSVDQVYLDATDGVTVAPDLAAEKFERAIWLAKQLRSDLTEITSFHSVEAERKQGSSRNTSTPFKLASARKIDPMIVNEINVDNVHSLTQLLDDLQAHSENLEQDATTFDVLGVTPVKSRAIGATPGRFGMFVLVLLSAAAAGFVALFPLADNVGFASVDAVSSELGVPVIAVVNDSKVAGSNSTREHFCEKLAGQLVDVAKVFLLTVLLVVIGFSLLDPVIRESIFQNPFDGFAKIFKVFLSYG